MTDDDARALLGAYAVDAVDDLERRAVERLVAHDPDAARELAELQQVAGLLGGAVASPPPPALRDSVLAAVATTPQDGAPTAARPGPATGPDEASATRPTGPAGPTGPTGPTPGARPAAPARWRYFAVAAAAAVVLAVPGTVAWQQHERAVQAEQRADLLAAALAEPDAQVLRGTLASGGDAVVVLTATRGVLAGTDLPDPGPGRTYQLWAMHDGVPVPAGLFGGGDATVEASAYAPGDGLAVSVEPAGGSEQPTTEPVLVLLPG